MKTKAVLSGIARVFAFTVFALVLLLFGLVIMLYSPWSQGLAREAVVSKFDGSDGGMRLSMSDFRLRFPLDVELSDLVVGTGTTDTMATASKARLKMAILPLITGEARIKSVDLSDASYRMGGPDSAMSLVILARELSVPRASVHLSDMAIDLPDAAINGGRMSLVMNPDTSAPTPPAPPTRMSVAIGKVSLDDFTFAMRMMPTIDTLEAHIAHSALQGGNVDLFTQKIQLGRFLGSGLDAKYIAPDSASIAATPVVPVPVVSDSSMVAPPWTVEIDSIAFNRSHALYTTAGVTPLSGLDFGYIEVDSLDLRISHFYNRQTIVKLPMSLRGTERCGVALAVDGTLDIDAEALTFTDINLSTREGTTAAFSGLLGMGDMVSDPTLPLRLQLDGAFAPTDLSMMFPDFKAYLKPIPAADNLILEAQAIGTTGHLDIEDFTLKLNRCLSLSANGYVENFMDPDRFAGNLSLNGNIINVNSFKNSLLEPATAKSLHIPPMTLRGNVAMRAGNIDGRLTARTGKGELKLDGRLNSTRESYKVNLATNAFPVQAFMPDMGVGDVTANVSAEGRGFDLFAKTTDLHATLAVPSAVYDGVTYRNINGRADIAGGIADVELASDETDLDFALKARGNLDGDVYSWTANIDGRNIDLYALKFATAPSSIEVTADVDATIGPTFNDIKAHLVVNDLFFKQVEGTMSMSDIDIRLDGSDSLTTVKLLNRDMAATFTSPMGIDSLGTRFSRASEIMAAQIADYMIDVDTIGRALPAFALDVHGGSSNLVNDILAPSKMSVRSFALSADNDSILTLNGFAKRFDTGSMRLDSVFINGKQRGKHMLLGAGVENKAGNLDEWHHVSLKALVDSNVVALGLNQKNLKGDTGFRFGLQATASRADSMLTLNVKPYKPVIGYQQWQVNQDNFISYHIPDKHIDANLRMQGGNSALAIYTQHEEHVAHADSIHGDDHDQEDLIISLTDIHISDWISFNPFAPPVRGDVNANLRLNREGTMIVGQGSAGISNFTYGKEPVADFRADFDVAAGVNGTINAKADLFVDGRKTMTLSGALNDSTYMSPLDLDFAMIHFPLSTVNPFLPAGTGSLTGTLNGNMKISGTDEHPIMNGTLDFDSTAVKLALTGTPYRFSTTPIDVENSVVHFNNFSISGCNENPLYVNGEVDISDMANMKINLGLKADNMQIVNSSRASKGADVFGKAFISLDASAHGNMNFLSVKANLSLLPETNVTYIVPDATSMIANQSKEGMVKFVNFTDSLAVQQADSLVRNGMAMLLDATLNIESGSIINVDLSADGQNRVQLETNGTLAYAMTPLDDGRLTGRLNINKGFVRYTPPLMSEKLFHFDDGSYVAFFGDMMNPTLNIHATDVLKANVTADGQNSRLINFDVLLSITGTLDRMNVAFDLATDDDMTVANELETMSPEQRANQAMNMLLYNVYTGPGTKGNASLSGNPLFSFLESQLNSWAANTIKGVDISFGINQYDRTVNGNTASTMSYSYQVSKSLFNDRFKIVVGGNYSTDANADENFSQNLINDISFEYFLNQQRTMYLRLFRHTGYESILEGEITQTGVGFVYRRKLRRIGDMFLPQNYVRRREQRQIEKESSTTTETPETPESK